MKKTYPVIYFNDYNETNTIKELTGEENDIFKEFYQLNNSLRYCNGSYYKFKDEAIKAKYLTWYKNLSHSESFNLYYGNGIVD